MHEYERLEAYQVKKILKRLEEKTEVSRERSTKMSCGSHEENLYAISKSRQMKVLRDVKKSIEVGVKKMAVNRCRCQACVMEQITISRTEAQLINLAIEKLSRRQELSRSIHQVSRRC